MTSEGLVIKTKQKMQEKLTVEMWSQKNDTVASFGFGIRQRLLTNSCFGYFFTKKISKYFNGNLSRSIKNWILNFNTQFCLSLTFCIGFKVPGCLNGP